MTLNQLKTRAKAHDLFIRKDGKGGYLLTDFLNRLMAPGPMTLEEVEMWLDDLDEHQQQESPLASRLPQPDTREPKLPPKGRLVNSITHDPPGSQRKDGITYEKFD